MRERIGFVAVGQCGGNIVNEFEKRGYVSYYINTSKEDLSTLSSTNKFHIPNAEGCNHDRDKAIDYAKKYYKELISQIGSLFQQHQFVYVVFGTGGGTGSGLGPILTDLLSRTYPGTVFGIVAILPSSRESIKTQSNAYRCMIEVSKLENIGNVFVVDNNKGEKFKLNADFAELFDKAIEMPSYVSIKGNIDTAEIKELLSVRGCAVIAVSKAEGLIYPNIIESLQNNIFADMEKDQKLVYAAYSLGGDCDIVNLNNYTGVPVDVFVNYNNKNINIAVLSGLSFPATRIDAIRKLLENNRDRVEDVVSNSKAHSLREELDWDIRISKRKTKQANEEIDFKDIFSRY